MARADLASPVHVLLRRAVVALCQLAFAQDAVPTPSPAPMGPGPEQSVDFMALLKSIELLCLPALTTLFLQWIKLGWSFVPDKALPFAAPLVAAIINGLTQWLGGINLTPVNGLVASTATAALMGGGSSVMMNQMVKQLGKPSNELQQSDKR
jgi:hypothetical protein